MHALYSSPKDSRPRVAKGTLPFARQCRVSYSKVTSKFRTYPPFLTQSKLSPAQAQPAASSALRPPYLTLPHVPALEVSNFRSPTPTLPSTSTLLRQRQLASSAWHLEFNSATLQTMSDEKARQHDRLLDEEDASPSAQHAVSRSNTATSSAPTSNMSGNPLFPVLSYCGSSILMTVTNKYVLSGTDFNLNFFLICVQVRLHTASASQKQITNAVSSRSPSFALLLFKPPNHWASSHIATSTRMKPRNV